MSWQKTFSKLSLVLAVALAACHPGGPEYVNDVDIVFTNYNSAYNFKSKGTFAIPSKIVKITGKASITDPPVYIPDAIATVLLTQMSNNMIALGYQKVDISASPSLILAPAAMESTTVVYWYDYWGWYWGGYYPGWGYPYYPYYPSYSYSSYSTGTVIMMLIDPATTAGDGNPISQWTGAINGLLTYSFDATRATKGIDQAFKQSPYLKK